MDNFSARRLFVNVVLLLMAVFMCLAAISRLSSFIKANSIKVENEKIAEYPVYASITGEVYFVSLPVKSPSDGSVEKLVGNFSFVYKGELLGRIHSDAYTTDIISPGEGVLLWGYFDKYFSDVESIENYKSGAVKFNPISSNVLKGDIVCSILNNDYVYVKLGVNRKSIYLKGDGWSTEGINIYPNKNFSIYKMEQFTKYFINKNVFLVLEGVKKGVKLNKSVVVKKGSTSGIYIVSYNVIRFLPVKIYALQDGYVLASGNFDSNSVIVVSTPGIVRDGEIFNE